jgi:hypothetical protein
MAISPKANGMRIPERPKMPPAWQTCPGPSNQPPKAIDPTKTTHEIVTLFCQKCRQTWNADRWASKPLNVELEEVEHSIGGCNGSVSVLRIHRHVFNGQIHCKCMIKPEPTMSIPIPPPDLSVNGKPMRK